MPIDEPVLILPVTDVAAALTVFGGAPAVVHCVRGVGRAIVACPAASMPEVEAALHGTDARAIGVDGAADAGAYLRAALAHVDSATVLVHDVRHALASPDLRERVVAELDSEGTVVVPAVPMVDSVKQVDADGNVVGTVDRETLRSLQFPRGFRREVLTTGFEPAATTFVAGDADAFALDLPRDAGLAEAVLARRSG